MRKRIYALIGIVAMGFLSSWIVEGLKTNSMFFTFVNHALAVAPETKLPRDVPALSSYGIKYGFIDHNGVMKIAAHFDDASDFHEGLAAFRIGKRWGYIDTTGSITIPAKFYRASDFSDGLAAVKVGRLWGYIDKNGKLVVNPQFNTAESFKDGTAVVSKVLATGLIDRKGETVFPLTDGVRFGELSDGTYKITIENKSGFIRADGSWLSQPLYADASDFSEGLAAFNENGKCGYIDKTGTVVIEPRYKKADKFVQGAAIVELDNNKSGIIDRKGKLLIKPTFNGLARIMLPAQSGATIISGNGLTPFAEPSGWGFFRNDTGKTFVKPQFLAVEPFSEGMACVGKFPTKANP